MAGHDIQRTFKDLAYIERIVESSEHLRFNTSRAEGITCDDHTEAFLKKGVFEKELQH